MGSISQGQDPEEPANQCLRKSQGQMGGSGNSGWMGGQATGLSSVGGVKPPTLCDNYKSVFYVYNSISLL